MKSKILKLITSIWIGLIYFNLAMMLFSLGAFQGGLIIASVLIAEDLLVNPMIGTFVIEMIIITIIANFFYIAYCEFTKEK